MECLSLYLYWMVRIFTPSKLVITLFRDFLTFSGHKHRPLVHVKPMMVIGTDGYILSVLGPYLAEWKNNDAAILNSIIQKNVEEIKNLLEKDNHIVVDRGYRDSIDSLEKFGLKHKMPDYLSSRCKQHTTEEANHSWCVIKVRWVVESANGRRLDQAVLNTHIKWIGDYVKTDRAIINAFRPPLTSNSNDDIALANVLKTL